MHSDQIGFAPYTVIPSSGDYADLAAKTRQTGYVRCDTRPGATSDVKIRKKTGPKAKTKYTRCPGCGGMVIAPCIACNPETAYDPRLNTESPD